MTEEFDVVVIGSGVGGCSTASRASEHGLKVLMLDLGSAIRPSTVREIDVSFTVDGINKTLKVPSVVGQGGNSSIYGGHLTRYPPHYWNESSDTHIPVSYERASVYYDELIRKFDIKHKSFNKSELKIKAALENSGFTSEEIIWAVSNHQNCNGCGGVYCNRNCKKDFFSVLCNPLINNNKLVYWPDSTVIDVAPGKNQMSTLRINKSGNEILISAKYIVFSCGVFITPSFITKHFGNELTFQVLSNIGRRMMFHISDFFLLLPKFPIFSKPRTKLFSSKEEVINTNDTCVRYSIQSVGAELSGATVFRYLLRRNTKLFNVYPFVKKLLWVLSHIAAIPLSRAHVIATIVEDIPSVNNLLNINADNVSIYYNFNRIFSDACKEINNSIIKKLKSRFFIIKFGGDLNLNFGHAMGGMTMGIGPTYPVDEMCKVRGLSNVFVCDASILPRSAATNPSLTIAALGYHTADCILKLHKR